MLAAFAALLIGSMSGCGSAEPARLDAEREAALADSILSLTRQYNAAWESLSADRISAFHSDDFHYYWRGSTDASSRAEYDRLLREEILPSMQKWSAEMHDPYVKVLGPNAAVVSFEFSSGVLNAAGEPDDYGSGALTYVFERRDGKWKIVLIHESAAMPDGPGQSGKSVT